MRRLPLPEAFGALYVCPAGGTESEQSRTAHELLTDALRLYTEERRIAMSDPPSLVCTKMGKPAFRELPEVRFNLSHCKGLAAVLLSPYECGVDVEGIRSVREGVVRRVFSEAEQERMRRAEDPALLFTRLWTLKEAYVKAIGIGISYPMREVSFSLEHGEIRCTKDAAFWQTTEIEGFVVSACALTVNS